MKEKTKKIMTALVISIVIFISFNLAVMDYLYNYYNNIYNKICNEKKVYILSFMLGFSILSAIAGEIYKRNINNYYEKELLTIADLINNYYSDKNTEYNADEIKDFLEKQKNINLGCIKISAEDDNYAIRTYKVNWAVV